MNSKTFIKFCLAIIGIVVILGLVASALLYEEEIKEFRERTISFGIAESSALPSEKSMSFEEIYRTSIPFGSSRVYGRIYVVHDNERNVTCYLYKDGISCISDYYIGNQDI